MTYSITIFVPQIVFNEVCFLLNDCNKYDDDMHNNPQMTIIHNLVTTALIYDAGKLTNVLLVTCIIVLNLGQ